MQTLYARIGVSVLCCLIQELFICSTRFHLHVFSDGYQNSQLYSHTYGKIQPRSIQLRPYCFVVL